MDYSECDNCGDEIDTSNRYYSDNSPYCGNCVKEAADEKANPMLSALSEIFGMTFVDVTPPKEQI